MYYYHARVYKGFEAVISCYPLKGSWIPFLNSKTCSNCGSSCLRDLILARHNHSFLHRGTVSASDHAHSRAESVKYGEQLDGRRDSPIPHKFTDYGVIGNNLDARVTHAIVTVLANVDGHRARRFVVCPDTISSITKRQRTESGA